VTLLDTIDTVSALANHKLQSSLVK